MVFILCRLGTGWDAWGTRGQPAIGGRRRPVSMSDVGLANTLREGKWEQQDSNLRPIDYESTALTTELCSRQARKSSIVTMDVLCILEKYVRA